MSLLRAVTRTETITLSHLSGSPPRQVEATVTGAYAYHPQVLSVQEAEAAVGERRGYAVTHVKSGLRIWRTRTREAAARIAMWLETHSPLPADGDEDALRAWARADREGFVALSRDLRAMARPWDGDRQAWDNRPAVNPR